MQKKLTKPTQILPLQQSNDTKNLGIIAIQAKKAAKNCSKIQQKWLDFTKNQAIVCQKAMYLNKNTPKNSLSNCFKQNFGYFVNAQYLIQSMFFLSDV